MPDYNWPPMETRKVIGKQQKRLDGPPKAAGRAKYSSDFNRNDLLHATFLTCPHAHAKITAIDTSEAEKLDGVKAVKIVNPVGFEVQWEGTEVVAVAATSEEIARDAIHKIKVQYDVLPHLVNEADLSKAGNRAKAAGEQVTGDPDKAFQDADVVSEGHYGIPVITHCCLEPHGKVIEWKGDQVNYWPSTQNVYGVVATSRKLSACRPRTCIRRCSTSAAGSAASSLRTAGAWKPRTFPNSRGGRPVKLFLDRDTELQIAGNRPSAFADIKVAAKKDGTITSWQSKSWATGGVGGGGMPPIPYVFTEIPNKRLQHSAVSVNARAGARVARPESPAGVLPHLQRARGSGRETQDGSGGSVRQEPGLHGARRGLPGADRERRRADRLEAQLASARRGRQRTGEARPRPLGEYVGRSGPSQ